MSSYLEAGKVIEPLENTNRFTNGEVDLPNKKWFLVCLNSTVLHTRGLVDVTGKLVYVLKWF